ncbi:MAG: sialidase family protein [Ginsengibacter sp.]
MTYRKICEGIVSRHPAGTVISSVAAPRCALGPGGEIVCTFIAQSALGINDFKPMISRSYDAGLSWSEATLMWPDLTEKFSIFGSVSGTPSGELFFFGTRTAIHKQGEPFWSDATQGIKQNELIWARSGNGGVAWSDFKVIEMPFAGSAEAPGAMCITRRTRILCCYAPYNTFNPLLTVIKDRVICLWSDNEGISWNHSIMLQFPYDDSNGAEAWIIELADGRLLGTSWHIRKDADAPNAYALSRDAGKTWSATKSTGILGQSTALAPLNDGRALFLYNQRKYGDLGVWMAVVNPTEKDFGIQENQRIWATGKVSETPGLVNHDSWTNFAFGEPSALLLPGNDILVTLWCSQHSEGQIAYVKLHLDG